MNSCPIPRNISVANYNDERIPVDRWSRNVATFEEIVLKCDEMIRGSTDHKLAIGPDCGPPSQIFLSNLDCPTKQSKGISCLEKANRSTVLSSKIQDVLDIIEEDHYFHGHNSDNENATVPESDDDESYAVSCRAYHQRTFPTLDNKFLDSNIDDNTLPSEDDEIDNFNDAFLTDEMYLYNIEDYSIPLLSDESDDLNPSFLEPEEGEDRIDDNRALHNRPFFDSKGVHEDNPTVAIPDIGHQSSQNSQFPLRVWKDFGDVTRMHSRCLDIRKR